MICFIIITCVRRMRIEMEDEMSLKQCLCLCAFTHFEQTCQLLFMCGAASLNENTGQPEQSETDGKKRREERRVIYVGEQSACLGDTPKGNKKRHKLCMFVTAYLIPYKILRWQAITAQIRQVWNRPSTKT